MPRFTAHAQHLTNLTRRGCTKNLDWNNDCNDAFCYIVSCIPYIVSLVVLVLHDIFSVYCDASLSGIGGCGVTTPQQYMYYTCILTLSYSCTHFHLTYKHTYTTYYHWLIHSQHYLTRNSSFMQACPDSLYVYSFLSFCPVSAVS